MLRIALAGALALVLVPAAHAAVDCSASAIVPPPLPATVIEPVAMELYARPGQLGMPSGVLAPNASGEQSLEDMQPETCERLVAAANELSGLAFKCFRALVLTRKPLDDVLANWYARDNFGRSDCAQLEALMA